MKYKIKRKYITTAKIDGQMCGFYRENGELKMEKIEKVKNEQNNK